MGYYEEVAGDYDKILLSFEWAWLEKYFIKLYNEKGRDLILLSKL